MAHHAHPISEADHALGEEKSPTGRAIAGILAGAFFIAAIYSLFFGEAYYLIAAGIFVCIGAAFLVFALSGVRLGRRSKLREAVVNHEGMREDERYETKHEREMEADESIGRKEGPPR